MSEHALYMRLKRLCGRSPTGKLSVPEDINKQWLSGNRDELMLALVRALKSCGTENNHKTRMAVRVSQLHQQVFPKVVYTWQNILWTFLVVACHHAALQAEFQENLQKIHEQSRQRDEEVEGGWYTEERLEKDLGYSKRLGLQSTLVTPPISLLLKNPEYLLTIFHGPCSCKQVRQLIGKVKAYCQRFKSVLCRPAKYPACLKYS